MELSSWMQTAAHPERLPRLQCKSHGFLGRTEEAVSKVGFRLMCVCVSVGVGIAPTSRKVWTKPLCGESSPMTFGRTVLTGTQHATSKGPSKTELTSQRLSLLWFEVLKMEPKVLHTLGRC